MYGSAPIRLAVILGFGALAAYLPGYSGYPFSLDAWLWAGIRDVLNQDFWRLPIGVAAAMAVAEIAAAFCPPWRPAVRRPVRWALVIAAVGAALFWFLRVNRWFGDLPSVDRQEVQWWTIEAAEPLGAFTSYYTENWSLALGIARSTGFAVVSVVSGALALVAVFLWARELTDEWPWPFAMIVTGGFMLVFFGYPEKGTPKAMALVAWYFYAATPVARGSGGWLRYLAANVLLALAALMHESALCLLPAHAWVIWGSRRWLARIAGAAAFAAPVGAIVVYTLRGAPIHGGPWGNISAPWRWFSAYCTVNCEYEFWSAVHALDVLNCALVLAPVALLCWPFALARSRHGAALWLAIGSAACLFLSATWFPDYGYLRDWDIFALAPLVVSYHAAYVGVTQMEPRAFRRLAAPWIVGTAVHSATWWRFHHLIL